ncbi:MAG: hypothetical protein ABI045_06140 [Flavobacteriales bacterium]
MKEEPFIGADLSSRFSLSFYLIISFELIDLFGPHKDMRELVVVFACRLYYLFYVIQGFGLGIVPFESAFEYVI